MRLVGPQPAADVRCGEVQDAGGEVAPLVRHPAADLQPRHGQRGAPALLATAAAQGHVVAEQLVRLAVLVEQSSDRVVRRHSFQRDHRGLHQRLVRARTVAQLRYVGRRLRQRLDELGLEVLAGHLAGELQRPGRILEDLDRLQARDLREEPAAAGVHEQRLALHLQELQGLDPLGLVQRAPRLPLHELGRPLALGVDHQLDEIVAGAPWVAQERRGFPLIELGEPVAQEVQRVAQRATPFLVPSGLPAGLAAAVAAPALHAVHAAPRRSFRDLRLVLGREERERLGQVDQLHVLALLQVAQCRGQDLVAALLVVAERLAVDGDGERLVVRPGVVETLLQPLDQLLAAGEPLAEGDASRDRAVVEEDRDLPPVAQIHFVRKRRIEAGVAGVLPFAAGRPHPQGLVRGEHREVQALVGQRAQRREVHGGLRQPHALGGPAEPAAKIVQPPPDLRPAVAVVRQREDCVRVRLRDGVAVPAAPHALGVGLQDAPVHLRSAPLHPGEQRGPEVEGDVPVVVDDVLDVPAAVLQARRGVRAVALGRDPLVPIVERSGRVLHLDLLDPRVFARWLVEVSVQAQHAPVHGGQIVTDG